MTDKENIDTEMKAIVAKIENALIENPFSWKTYKEVNTLTFKWWTKAIKKALPRIGKG